jgi:nucleoside-diphosphate-sugar epimerase
MNKLNKVLITGGAGYCGSRLVPQLLNAGYEVTVYDTLYFTSDFLPITNPKLKVIEGDIRDVQSFTKSVFGHDAVINLACISNDDSFELDEELSTIVNFNAFEPMVKAAKKAGVKRFIYASSSSVYGVSDQPNVTEDHPLVPLTLYNKYKGMCEPLLFKHTSKDFIGVVFRPATVCGYSPRLRLDLSVNILTSLAISNGVITVYGGSQMRPNLHILDYCDVVQLLLESEDSKIADQIFNVGSQNLTINQISIIFKEIVEKQFPDKAEIKIETTSSNDNRSYHINSDKIKNTLNFVPQYSVENAVLDLCQAFKNKKVTDTNNDIFYNVRRLKRLQIK